MLQLDSQPVQVGSLVPQNVEYFQDSSTGPQVDVHSSKYVMQVYWIPHKMCKKGWTADLLPWHQLASNRVNESYSTKVN